MSDDRLPYYGDDFEENVRERLRREESESFDGTEDDVRFQQIRGYDFAVWGAQRWLVGYVERLRAENERLRAAVLDIDAHATSFGEDADGCVDVPCERAKAAAEAELLAVRAALEAHQRALLQTLGNEQAVAIALEWAVAAGVLASACICVRGSDGPDESCPVHGRAGSTPEADA